MAKQPVNGLDLIGKPNFILVSDLDHTMVQNEDLSHARLLAFNHAWNTFLSQDSALVFSTGRSPLLYKKLWEEAPLLTPRVLICSVGTEVFYRDESCQYHPDAEWEAYLDHNWDPDKVTDIAAQFPQLKQQVATEQRRHKRSYHLQVSSPQEGSQVLEQLSAALKSAGLAAKVIYSGGVDVDILSERAGKGKALEFLLQRLKEAGRFPAKGVQVNGDSGNDIELFQAPDVRGCVVSNAHPELRAFAQANAAHHIFEATQPCAGGIVETLRHFGTLPSQQQDQQSKPCITEFAWKLGIALGASVLHTSGSSDGSLGQLLKPGVQVPSAMKPSSAAPASGNGFWVDQLAVDDAASTIKFQVYCLTPEGMRDTTHVLSCSAHVQADDKAPHSFLASELQLDAVKSFPLPPL